MRLSQMPGLDAGIDLCCRQAGMAEQGLNRPKIGAMSQQMRRKTMAQRMWGGTVGQAERAAQNLHLFAQDGACKRLPRAP